MGKRKSPEPEHEDYAPDPVSLRCVLLCVLDDGDASVPELSRVCKYWRSMLASDEFVHEHVERRLEWIAPYACYNTEQEARRCKVHRVLKFSQERYGMAFLQTLCYTHFHADCIDTIEAQLRAVPSIASVGRPDFFIRMIAKAQRCDGSDALIVERLLMLALESSILARNAELYDELCARFGMPTCEQRSALALCALEARSMQPLREIVAEGSLSLRQMLRYHRGSDNEPRCFVEHMARIAGVLSSIDVLRLTLLLCPKDLFRDVLCAAYMAAAQSGARDVLEHTIESGKLLWRDASVHDPSVRVGAFPSLSEQRHAVETAIRYNRADVLDALVHCYPDLEDNSALIERAQLMCTEKDSADCLLVLINRLHGEHLPKGFLERMVLWKSIQCLCVVLSSRYVSHTTDQLFRLLNSTLGWDKGTTFLPALRIVLEKSSIRELLIMPTLDHWICNEINAMQKTKSTDNRCLRMLIELRDTSTEQAKGIEIGRAHV